MNGTISAWDGGSTAIVQVAGATGSSYTGLTINGAQTRLYAANDSLDRVDVFDSNFAPLSLGPNAFRAPDLPGGLVSFNVRDIGGDVYVTYAPAVTQPRPRRNPAPGRLWSSTKTAPS